MSWLNALSLTGCFAFGALAWAAGGFRRPFPVRTAVGGGALLAILGAVVFWLPPARTALEWVNDAVIAALDAGNSGARFLFGPLALNPGERLPTGEPSIGFVLAAQVLPAVIFFSALMAALYHLKVMQPLVRLFARVFHRTLGLSGAEALSGAANIFVGVESAMVVRPYLERMTRSELLTLITCGMATVASTVLGLYVAFLKSSFPMIAGHLVSASVIAIPAAAMTSKLLLPETGEPETRGTIPPIHDEGGPSSAFSALAAGAWDGLKLSAGIATLLIAVLGVVALADIALAHAGAPFAQRLGGPIDLGRILGWVFTPLAWLLGLDGGDALAAGRLLGTRAVMTEAVAYRQLGEMAAAGAVSPRGLLVLSYALCGFAHVASVGIFVGGTAALCPSRRDDLASLGVRAFVASTLATLLTGAVAGVFYHGQKGVLGL